jgi:dihydropteroate synthase
VRAVESLTVPRATACRGSPRRGAPLDVFRRPAILGILNVTPDSFSDGGRFKDVASAVAHARAMVADGADVIDVGGESTRPGAGPVAEAEELRRVMPVIERIRGLAAVSIDTTKAAVAAAALSAGATIVNDVSGATLDPAMLRVVAERGAGIILMHRRGTPRTMDRLARYRDVTAEVKRFLSARIEAALAAGIPRGAIAIDPGIGFAKTSRHNLTLLAHVSELATLGFPVVVGVSRKRFLGGLLGPSARARTEGTVAASLIAVAGGARGVRVHDVAPMARALRVAQAIWAVARG